MQTSGPDITFTPTVGLFVTPNITIYDTAAAGDGGVIDLYKDKVTPVDGDRIGEHHWYSNNSSGTKKQMTAIYANAADITAGTEDGTQLMNITANGNVVEYFRAEGSGTDVNKVGLTLGTAAYIDQGNKAVWLGEDLGTGGPSFRYTKTVAGAMSAGVANLSSAAGTYTLFRVAGNAGLTDGLDFYKFPSAWSSVWAYQANGATIEANSSLSGGLNLSAAGATQPISLYSNTTLKWQMTNAGNFITGTDNAYDIGASGATRPRTLFLGTSGISPLFNATTGFQVAGAAASGKILKGNGTNFVASTETYATPSTSGNVMTSDGTNWTSAAPAVSATSTTTFTNKRWTARVGNTASSATPTINTDNVDIYKITALAANITSFTTNLSGTPVDGDILEIQITDDGTPRTIAWGASFVSSSVALPTTTVASTTQTNIFQWYTTSSYGNNKWICSNSF